MWRSNMLSSALERANQIAQQAKEAAENLEKRLDSSLLKTDDDDVEQQPQQPPKKKDEDTIDFNTSIGNDKNTYDDDGWGDHGEDDDLVSITSDDNTIDNKTSTNDNLQQPQQQVDPHSLSQLMDMGFSKNGCTRALLAVGGSNVEAATDWIFDHSMDTNFNDDPFISSNNNNNNYNYNSNHPTEDEDDGNNIPNDQPQQHHQIHTTNHDTTIVTASSDETVCISRQSNYINTKDYEDNNTNEDDEITAITQSNNINFTTTPEYIEEETTVSQPKEALEQSESFQPTTTTTIPPKDDNMEEDNYDDSSYQQQNQPTTKLESLSLAMDGSVQDYNNYDDLNRQIQELKYLLQKREDQLSNVNTQLSTTILEHERQIRDYQGKIDSTKEEAKRRIQRAKERVDEMQSRMVQLETNAKVTSESNNYQLLEQQLVKERQISAELREEGEALALKQSSMEQLVRAARTEARDFSDKLLTEQDKVKKVTEKLEEAQKKNKALEKELEVARRGAETAKKLENELLKEKSDNQNITSIKLSLEQQIVDLKRGLKEALRDAEEAMISQGKEGELLSQKLRKEHEQVLADLEEKLKRAERESHIREESLRQEIQDLRKRWQDAIRRADSLSMDLQESTAPLLRQIQSAEKQARVRAAAWAEVESKLRSDLESCIMENETMSKERAELSMTIRKLERNLKEKCDELAESQERMDKLSLEMERLNDELDNLERDKEDLLLQKKLASEEMSKAKSDLLKNAVDNEERYRARIDALEDQLESEKAKRVQLEESLENLLASTDIYSGINTTTVKKNHVKASPGHHQQQSLKAVEGQVKILQHTIDGLGIIDVKGETGRDADDDTSTLPTDPYETFSDIPLVPASAGGSFAAVEQLSQGLKAAKTEIETLRKQIRISEQTRENLQSEIESITKQQSVKNAALEAKIAELTAELVEKDNEIQGLREGMQEMRLMYREQLDELLEEKALAAANNTATATNIKLLSAFMEGPEELVEENVQCANEDESTVQNT